MSIHPKNKNNQDTTNNFVRRNNLPSKIIIMSSLTAFVGIAGILILLIQISTISNQYKKMISNDYSNIQYMDEISQQLYKHQVLVYKYIDSTDASEREELLVQSDNLKESIKDTLISFGTSMKGNEYESLYHNIYSNANGYFANINHVFTFLDTGDVNTADYYINLAMENCIISVNDSIDELDSITKADMEKTQASLYVHINFSRILSFLGVVIIIVFAVYCVIYSARTADEMISVDSLTDVYNYDKLLRFAEKMWKKGRLQEYTVISINLKDFKYINQQNGSSVGDQVLKQYALNLYPRINNQELICRSGGDNFILLIKSPNTSSIVNYISEVKIELPDQIGSKDITIKSRCGIYNIKAEDTISEALNNASIALNKARISTTNFAIYFNEDMVNEMVAEKETLSMFEDAIKKEQFLVYYQPKVDMPTGKLCGAEALVRWVKEGRIVPPISFIPILEKDGSITDLDFYVFDHVCSDIERWTKEGKEVVKISSNFSKLHLQNSNFAEDVLSTIRRHHVDPKYIEVELTESSGYEDFEALKSFIARMKKAGVSTSMDDFGTGYSSLSMLQDLDVDVVKLDKTFIDHIGSNDSEDMKNRKMVENVVHMVNDLQRKVICEGIETIEQAKFLVESGCQTAQGYLYNRPLPRDEFEGKLDNPQYELTV